MRIVLAAVLALAASAATAEPYLCVLPKGCHPDGISAKYTAETRQLDLTCGGKSYSHNIAQFLPFNKATGKYDPTGSDVTSLVFVAGNQANVPLCIPNGLAIERESVK